MATGNRSGAQTRMQDRKPMGKSLAKRSKDGHNYSGRGIQREKKRSALKNTRIDVEGEEESVKQEKKVGSPSQKHQVEDS